MVHKTLKPVLIDDWRRSWRFASVRFNAAGLMVLGSSSFLNDMLNQAPDVVKQHMPHANLIAAGLFGAALVGRILKKADIIHSKGDDDGDDA